MVKHATAQRRGDAHHAVELVLADKLAPLAGDVLLVLGATMLVEALCTPS